MASRMGRVPALLLAGFVLLCNGRSDADCRECKRRYVFLLQCRACDVACKAVLLSRARLPILILLDFCSGGEEETPAGTIREIMEVNGFNESDLVFEVVSFYMAVSSLV